jgi:hypothetical protein
MSLPEGPLRPCNAAMRPLTVERSAASSSPVGDAQASVKSSTARSSKERKVEKATDLEIL